VTHYYRGGNHDEFGKPNQNLEKSHPKKRVGKLGGKGDSGGGPLWGKRGLDIPSPSRSGGGGEGVTRNTGMRENQTQRMNRGKRSLKIKRNVV